MTGRELRDILDRLPDGDLDLEIELYLPNHEDGEAANEVVVRSAADEPYYKGDGPWRSNGVPEDERLIYIQ